MDNSEYSKKMISIVIPCFNESGNILALYSELSVEQRCETVKYLLIGSDSAGCALKAIKRPNNIDS